MSHFLQSLMEQRRKFLDGLDANEDDINLDIFEDFYPDQAHFVFELLQNAEDAGATEVAFTLTKQGAWFEHNGSRAFSEADVRAITGIHNSTKTKSPDQIGKFGIGFKSVFVYTQTPTIHAADFSFQITKYVMPEPVAADPLIGRKTKFWLPFDNPNKMPDVAHTEITGGLNELAETSLLFLPNIESIKWSIGENFNGEILRIAHTDTHVEVMKQINGKIATSAHFLKFDQAVNGLEKLRVAIAFSLDFLPNVQSFSSEKPLAKQLRIVQAQGQVAVFFPANKESSGLRFHLHAPFVPELSRASIKATPANNPLFDQLAVLVATSLHQIRDLGLLTTDFLGVLPNPQDRLGDGYGYQKIRDTVFDAMKTQALFPTHDKGHAPAQNLFQAKAALKDLLTDADIEFLIDYDEDPPRWAANRALQGTNVERFMTGLDIPDWDIDSFIECLEANTTENPWSSADEDFIVWLSEKSVEWHQQLYSLLDRESEAQDALDQLTDCRIIRTKNRTYAKGCNCFYTEEGRSEPVGMLLVEDAVYTSGKGKAQQDAARRFLDSVGVSIVGERQLVEALLKSNYSSEIGELSEKAHIRDLRRFMKLLDDDPSASELLAKFSVLRGGDNKWHKARDIYLDTPYVNTGLTEYLSLLGTANRLVPLAELYVTQKIDVAKFVQFTEKLGAQTRIGIVKTTCDQNPQKSHLYAAPGERYTSHIDRDFGIVRLSLAAKQKSERLSLLIWRTMSALNIVDRGYDSVYGDNPLRAVYRKNERGGAHFADSHLVHQLRSEAWVPQKGGHFVRPSDARPELLPDGFTFDAGWIWIKAIHFGKSIKLQSERARAEAAEAVERVRKDREAAQILGFNDVEMARKFAEIPAEELKAILAERTRRMNFELPNKEPGNLSRRSDRVSTAASAAPERQTVDRTRSVSIGREEVKIESDQYLQQQYTNADADQICQICKDVLPFRLDSGGHFFETVELLPELKKRHYQNYLCLCPNHSAMFRFANGSKQSLTESITLQTGNEVPVVLANQELMIYFTKTHLADLQAIIKTEANEPSTGAGA